jgi:hypothetical protein
MRRAKWFLGAALIVVVAAAALESMVKVHVQDFEVYSDSPKHGLQVIGLQTRTYLLDYGGPSDLVLFGTTTTTGIATYGIDRDETARPAGRRGACCTPPTP